MPVTHSLGRSLGRSSLPRCVRASLTGRTWLERVSITSPPAPPLAPPTPCGCAERIATDTAVAGLRIRGSSWIFGVNGCNVARRNEKTRREAGSSEGMVLPTPDLRGNRFGGTVLPKHLPSLRHGGACIKQIPSKPCYQWPQPLALWRVSRDWDQGFVALGGVAVGPNGETLHTAQSRSGAPQHRYTHRQA